MTEKRYAYTPIPPPSTYDNSAAATTASAKLKSMDAALRAEILSNARRQYESAARELRLRAQAEAHAYAQVQAQAEAEARLQRRRQLQSSMYARLAQTQERPQAQVRAMGYPHVQTRGANSQYERPSRYSSQSVRPHSSSNVPIPSPSPNTPTQMLYRFRHDPKQAGPSTAGKTAEQSFGESSPGVEELKRRYYAQLSNQTDSAYSRAAAANLYQDPRRPSASGTAMSNPRSHHGYGHVGTSSQTKTMADEYLDYYMPARRGPHSVPSHQSRRESQYRQTQREIPERAYEQDVRRRSPVYVSEVSRQAEVSSRQEERPDFERKIETSPVTKVPVVRPEPSKGKLAFLLNPAEPGDSKPNLLDRQEGALHNDIPQIRSDNDSPSPSSRTDPRSFANAGGYNPPHEASTSRNGERDDLQVTSSRPEKRKAPWAPSPGSSGKEDASSEDEAPPRAKRRAFGRLPAEYDSQSDLAPEEEEMDEAYLAEMSKSNRESNKTRARHDVKVECPATNRSDRPELKLGHARRRYSEDAESRTRGIAPKSPEGLATNNKRRRARSDGGLVDDLEMATSYTMEEAKQNGPNSESPSEENKKYDFRPRTKPHSR